MLRYICALFAIIIPLASVACTQSYSALTYESGLPGGWRSDLAQSAASAAGEERQTVLVDFEETTVRSGRSLQRDDDHHAPDGSRSSPPSRGAKSETRTLEAEGAVQARRTIVIDPGHGGEETGAVASFLDGRVVLEKDLALQVGLETADILRAKGYDVVLTRETDESVNRAKRDVNGDGVVNMSDDLQARVDIANAAQADLFVSIHFNSVENAATRGTEVIYNSQRPFAADSRRLAQHIHARLLDSLREGGYEPVDRGVRKDVDLLGYPLFVLAPQSRAVVRATQMPAALGEGLFMSNPIEKAMLTDDEVLSRMARAYAEAVDDYYR